LFGIKRDLLIYLRGGATQGAQFNPWHRIDAATQLFNGQIELLQRKPQVVGSIGLGKAIR